jgi:hypothetical protein
MGGLSKHFHLTLDIVESHVQLKLLNSIYTMRFFLFVRHYSGNICYFLVLRLIICLNSAGSLAQLGLYKRGFISSITNLLAFKFIRLLDSHLK